MFVGFFICIACIIATTVTGGMDPAFRKLYPGIIKMMAGGTFPIALIFVLFMGGDLFTGNIMFMTMAFVHGKASIRMCAEVLIFSFFTNFGWFLFFDWFLAFKTELFIKEPFLSQCLGLGLTHLNQDWGVVVLKGVGANSLVCMGVFMGTVARSGLSKIVLIWVPVAVFVTIGYEHVVANMGFVPIAMMYGADISPNKYIRESVVPSAIGNWIGGGFLLGVPLVYLYAWESRSFRSIYDFLVFNFVPTTTFAEEYDHYSTKMWNNVSQVVPLAVVDDIYDDDESKMDK
jgi:formate/nitrite transporter